MLGGLRHSAEELADIPATTPPPLDSAITTDKQTRYLAKLFTDAGMKSRDQQLAVASATLGRPVASRRELTKQDVATLIDALKNA